jgi:betaine-aldehyde dehydrogenase
MPKLTELTATSTLANADLLVVTTNTSANTHRVAQLAARKIKAGTVWINCHNRLMVEAETGGYRDSGLGRLHGIEGLGPFLETKHIYTESKQW